MQRITYQQVRKRLAKIMKNIFTKRFEEIYTSNIENYTESQIRKRNVELREELQDFAHKVYENRNNPSELNALYVSVSPEMICCFYYRYWVIINLLQMSQQVSPTERFSVEEDDEALLLQLLFDKTGL